MKKFKKIIATCMATVMAVSISSVSALATDKGTSTISYANLFGNKELLSYFLLTEDLKMKGDLERFVIELDISDEELATLYDIANVERENASLYSKGVLTDEELAEKYSEIDTALSNLLDNYTQYKDWIAKWYVEDIEYRNNFADFVSRQDTRSGANRRYYVFATQFSNTSQGVALPDKYIKFANLGWHSDIPANVRQYYYNTPYTVNLYNPNNDKTVLSAPVVDSGPWNTDDAYWNPSSERRMFADLEQGKPEAQAAFQNKYNSGKDQFGRTVLNPAGIDLTSNMSSKLGMGSGNAWIYVNFNNLP